MKINITKEAKQWITIAEMPVIKQIVNDMREYDITEDYQMIARAGSGSNDEFEILGFTAEIAKNNRVFEQWGTGSGNLDIWLEIKAFNSYEGFFVIGCYITDAWQIGAISSEEFRSRSFIWEYKNH